MKIFKKTISVIVWTVVALTLWEVTSFILANIVSDPLAAKKIPEFSLIASAFSEFGGYIFSQAGVTYIYAFAGFLFGALVGIVLAVIMQLSGIIEKMLLPYLLISQMIPILGLAPIIFGLVKDIAASRVVIAAYITFFPVSVSLLSGFKVVPPNLMALMHLCAAGRVQTYLKLLFPSAFSNLFSGLKIAAPMAVTVSILVDTLSAKDGIGYVIIMSLYGGGTVGGFWPAIIIAALMGLLSFVVVWIAEYFAVPWKRGKKNVQQ